MAASREVCFCTSFIAVQACVFGFHLLLAKVFREYVLYNCSLICYIGGLVLYLCTYLHGVSVHFSTRKTLQKEHSCMSLPRVDGIKDK